ncbi:MAG: NAD(P)H-dependent oxidoreductase [Myxococcota bacterium]
MTIRLLGLSGSLRARSYNTALLRASAALLPDGVQLDIFPLHPIPMYNGDIDNDEDRPQAVVDLQTQARAADGLLMAMPEYNYGVPGVLKNAIDWLSRPAFRSPLAAKPVGIMGASPGSSGTMRGQEQLKLNLMATLARPFPHPGVAVRGCHEFFDDDMVLTDEKTRQFITNYLDGLRGWIMQLQKG